MKYFTSTSVCLETSCFRREVNTSSRLQENISLDCQLLLFQLDWRASSCCYTLLVRSDCRRQMRAMRVVVFVVYFNSGLFSGKKSTLKFSHAKMSWAVWCWIALEVGCSCSPFPPLAGFCLGLATSDIISADGQALNSLCWLPECFCFSV